MWLSPTVAPTPPPPPPLHTLISLDEIIKPLGALEGGGRRPRQAHFSKSRGVYCASLSCINCTLYMYVVTNLDTHQLYTSHVAVISESSASLEFARKMAMPILLSNIYILFTNVQNVKLVMVGQSSRHENHNFHMLTFVGHAD
jgi:hypothetical protein